MRASLQSISLLLFLPHILSFWKITSKWTCVLISYPLSYHMSLIFTRLPLIFHNWWRCKRVSDCMRIWGGRYRGMGIFGNILKLLIFLILTNITEEKIIINFYKNYKKMFFKLTNHPLHLFKKSQLYRVGVVYLLIPAGIRSSRYST